MMKIKNHLTIFGVFTFSLLFLIWPINLVYATTNGPNNPGTNANDSAIGTTDWTNRDNDKTSNNQYATTQGLNDGGATVYLKATNFGFSVPVGVIIDGISVEVERKASDTNFFDNAVRIVKNGTVKTTDRSNADAWPTSDETITYGGASDLWGETWTVADINSNSFGFAISAKKVGGATNQKPSIDWINISVTYHVPIPPTVTSVSPLPAGTVGVDYAQTLTVADGTPPLVWSIFSGALPAGLSLASTTGAITGLPTAADAPTIGFKVTDSLGASSTASLLLTINKAVPVITWANPTSIIYGAPLSATQLNASTSVAGSFVYTPAADAILNAGVQTLSALFTPTDLNNYASTTVTASLTVAKGGQTITWANPADIIFGAALGVAELNAAVTGSGPSVPGALVYDPALGAVLAVGAHTLSVTAQSTANYDSATATATINILPAPIPNTAPVVSAVAITGESEIGQTLTGHYTYSDADGDIEGDSTFRWLRDEVAIGGATALTYVSTILDVGAAIKFEVTPAALTGTTPGLAMSSAGVTIDDAMPPVIILLGAPTVELTVGDTYADAGATANDDIDGDITSQIIITGLPIDTSSVGTSTIRYNIADTAGNPADEVTRTVVVRAVDDPTPPAADSDIVVPIVSHTSYGTGYIAGFGPQFLSQNAARVLGVKTYNWQRNLTVGSRGTDVKALQQNLIGRDLGPLAGLLGRVGATGYFGPLTKAALAEYQRSEGIKPPVGYFGPITRKSL